MSWCGRQAPVRCWWTMVLPSSPMRYLSACASCRAHLATDYYLQGEDRYEKALPKEARPTVTFFTGDQTLASDKRIEYGQLLEAHTDGDIYVFFRDANVLAAGEAISPQRDPELDWFGGGWLGGRVDAQEKLLKLTNADTQIVPSYGTLVARAKLQA